MTITNNKNKTLGHEVWSVEKDREYRNFFNCNLQRRYELKIKGNKFKDFLFQYDVISDPFNDLSSSYFCNIPIWLFCLILIVVILSLIGTLAAVFINIYAPQNFSNYGQICDNYILCDPRKNLICSFDGFCVCSNQNLYWNNISCSFKKLYGESCESSNECLAESLGLYCTKNTSDPCNCPKLTKSSMCDCPSTQFFHPYLNRCVDKLKYGSICGFNQQCQTKSGLKCEKNYCNCSDSQYYNGSFCISKKQYKSGFCNSSIECNNSQGLECINHVCMCPSNQFFNESSQRCADLTSINGYCKSDNHCIREQTLKCSGEKCVCKFGFWSHWLKKCIECDSKNWTNVSNACYYFSNKLTTWDEAQIECAKRGSNLCMLSTNTEMDIIQSFFLDSNETISQQFWIGLRTQKSGGFTWTADNSSVSSDFMFWCPGQPSNSGGNRLTLAEPCVVAKYTRDSFCFDDLKCNLKRRFCCEKNT